MLLGGGGIMARIFRSLFRIIFAKEVRPPTVEPRMAEKAAMIELSMGDRGNYFFAVNPTLVSPAGK
jgi:hypothetical protein